jgi:hypothetical protein
VTFWTVTVLLGVGTVFPVEPGSEVEPSVESVIADVVPAVEPFALAEPPTVVEPVPWLPVELEPEPSAGRTSEVTVTPGSFERLESSPDRDVFVSTPRDTAAGADVSASFAVTWALRSVVARVRTCTCTTAERCRSSAGRSVPSSPTPRVGTVRSSSVSNRRGRRR